MPVYEYRCTDCGYKFDFLHKSSTNTEQVDCPNCHSKNNVKLFSAFNASVKGGTSSSKSEGSCADGSCGLPSYGGGCASGMCGLN